MWKGASSPPSFHLLLPSALLICMSLASSGASRLLPLPQLLVPASPCLLSSSSGSAQPPLPPSNYHPQLQPRAPLPPLASEDTKQMEDPPSESPVLRDLPPRWKNSYIHTNTWVPQHPDRVPCHPPQSLGEGTRERAAVPGEAVDVLLQVCPPPEKGAPARSQGAGQGGCC